MSGPTSPSEGLPAGPSGRLRPEPFPDAFDPMLAKSSTGAPGPGSWLYERKLDGQRVLGFHDGDRTWLRSRNHRDLNQTYPELQEALHAQAPGPCIVDGEVVALVDGDTSFSELQRRMHLSSRQQAERSPVPVAWLLFDLLHLKGRSTRELGTVKRKRLLEQTIDTRSPIAILRHTTGHGEKLLDEACREGWEGLIAKRQDRPYVAKRSRDWQKLKCIRQQEFVVGGFTDPQGGRSGFGALLLGYYEGGSLVYVGKVGTGFDDELLEGLTPILERLEQPNPPFEAGQPPRKGHWVDPRIVVEVAYAEWTPDDRLRHPRFKGIRPDKDPNQVVRQPIAARPER